MLSVMSPQMRIQPMWPGQMGVPGSDLANGLRLFSQGVTLFVDHNHHDASDTHDGTDPEHPLLTIQGAVNRLGTMRVAGVEVRGSVIYVAEGDYVESVVTPDYATGPSYVTIVGVGDRYSPYWTSDAANLPCLDMRAVGWRVTGFRFGAPTAAACIELRHTDSGANDIAIRTIIDHCLFDGLTTGLYGIHTHGCYDVWITDNVFQLFNNAGNTATALYTGTTPLAIPYRNHVIGNVFWDNDNHAIFPCNGSRIEGNIFQRVGYAYTAVQVLNTSTIANPGDDNIVTRNVLTGDYSIVGGYRGGAADIWIGNFADDLAEAEVGDNGLTILPPA